MSELGASDEGSVEEPLFLKVRSRDTLLVGEDKICKVLSFVAGSRDPDALSLFQPATVGNTSLFDSFIQLMHRCLSH